MAQITPNIVQELQECLIIKKRKSGLQPSLSTRKNISQNIIIILTSSSNSEDITYCYEMGVKTYITKPCDLTEFENSIRTLYNYWLNYARLPEI